MWCVAARRHAGQAERCSGAEVPCGGAQIRKRAAKELCSVYPLGGAQGRWSAAEVLRNRYTGAESHVGRRSGGHYRQARQKSEPHTTCG